MERNKFADLTGTGECGINWQKPDFSVRATRVRMVDYHLSHANTINPGLSGYSIEKEVGEVVNEMRRNFVENMGI